MTTITFEQAMKYVKKDTTTKIITPFVSEMFELDANEKGNDTIHQFCLDIDRARAKYIVNFNPNLINDKFFTHTDFKTEDEVNEFLDEIAGEDPERISYRLGFPAFYLTNWTKKEADYAVKTFEIPVVEYPYIGYILCLPFMGCSSEQVSWKVFDEKFNEEHNTKFEIAKRKITFGY